MNTVTAPTHTLEEMVLVHNEGSEPFTDIYLGVSITIAPGGESSLVRREAAILWFGNPAAIDHVDNGELKEDRTKECERLDARYGVFPIRRDEQNTTPAKLREEAWPKVRVTSVQGKETYRMVVNDPEGIDLQPKVQTKGEYNDLRDTIDALKARIESYEAEVARGVQPPGPTQDAPTDTPSRRSKAS